MTPTDRLPRSDPAAGPGRSTVAVALRGLWAPLRTRVALAAAAAALVALLVTGGVVLASATAADRRALDQALIAQAAQAARTGAAPSPPPAPARPNRRPARQVARRVRRLLGPRADTGDVGLLRVVQDGRVVERLGTVLDPGLPTTAPTSPTTVDTDRGRWRVVQRPAGRGVAVQAASPMSTIDDRSSALRSRLLLALAIGVLATALLAWLLAGPALAALTRLRQGAGRVADTADLDVRMPAEDGPREVRELASTLNAMLARLQAADADRRAALEATRRFSSDAGHELRTPLTAIATTVEALRRHRDLPAAERAAMLDEIAEEHARTVALLDALQALARGDAAARLAREPVDLVDLAEQAAASARRAFPRVTIRVDAPVELVLHGWPPGLRMVLDNLLSNAARHGRPDGTIVVRLQRDADGDRLLVDDDGPGVPAADRDAVRERFVRGADRQVPGSGLGLAIVEQQVRLHGGQLVLEDGPDGGLRARVELSRGPAAT